MGKNKKSAFVCTTARIGYKGLKLEIPLSLNWCMQFAPLDGAKCGKGGDFEGELRSSGTGFILRGVLSADFSVPCNRCLESVGAPVQTEFTHYYSSNGEEAENEGLGVTAVESDEIDVEPIVGEELVLALPTYVLCKEGCKGLCVGCGTNLNEAPCVCEAVVDPRWDKLKALEIKGK